jgi:putative transcription factor
MEFQNWTEVKWDKRGERSKNQSKADYIKEQTRKNNVTSILKSGSSNSNKVNVVTNFHKIDKEEETFILPKVSMSVSKRIAQARCEKKLTQKELAFKLSLPVKIIQEYENGKAIPNPIILNKIESILGTRVRDSGLKPLNKI